MTDRMMNLIIGIIEDGMVNQILGIIEDGLGIPRGFNWLMTVSDDSVSDSDVGA
jgi:hypothetical protein